MSSTNQPTNQPTVTYLSVRVTVPHSRQNELVQKLLHDVSEWCIYKHGGINGITEHFHICIVGSNPERYRKRLRDSIGGGTKSYTVKQFTGQLHGYVFYCAHEGTTPIFQGPQWPELIEAVKRDGCYKKNLVQQPIINDRRDRDWQLSHSNLVRQCTYYQKRNLPKEHDLKNVLRHMIKHTKWAPSRELIKAIRADGSLAGIYQRDFEFRIGIRDDPDLSWWPKHVD